MRYMLVSAALILLPAAALADDVVKIIEPAAGPVTRRTVDVIARVDSKTRAKSATVTVKRRGNDPKEFEMEAVARRPGWFAGKVPVPSSGTVDIEVRVRTDKGSAATASVTVEAKRGFANNGSMIGIGFPVQPVTAKTADGHEVSIDTKGPVLVHFYSAWDDCKKEIEWLGALDKKYGKKGLKIIGVASVGPADYEAWTKYLANAGARWKNVPDPVGAIGKNWNDSTHEVVGSQADACFTFFMQDRKVAGGDWIAADCVGTLERCCTEEALAKAFP
jgi:hypothetical protein